MSEENEKNKPSKDRSMSLREAMNRIFDEPFLPTFEGGWMPEFPRVVRGFPRMDISETDKSLEVAADVPGINPEKINVDIRDGVLTISYEDVQEEEKKDKKYHRYERRSGSFSRSVALPKEVEEDKVQAEIKDGVLKVSFPKIPDLKKKSIHVEIKK